MNAETIIENVFHLKEKLAEDALAQIFRVEIDLHAFDYNLLYAYTQVQGDTHAQRVRAAVEYARRLAGKRLDPETIRTILETHGMPLPQKDAAILLAKEGVDIEHFRSEWRNLLFLNHPHLVQVYGGGLWQGHPYCVMEHFPEPLAPNLACSRLTLAEKLTIAIAAGEGVAHLHEKGLVHWDLRPENILILPADNGGHTAKVTALGLTHGIDDLLGKASAGEVLESLCCMAPEMVRGQGTGLQSDIYSLGACLYLLMTGHLPHDRKKRLFEIFESLRIGEPPTSARELAPDLPEGVANLLDRAMAADPDRRYGSMQEMLADLKMLHADPHAPVVPPFKKREATPSAPVSALTPAPAPVSATAPADAASIATLPSTPHAPAPASVPADPASTDPASAGEVLPPAPEAIPTPTATAPGMTFPTPPASESPPPTPDSDAVVDTVAEPISDIVDVEATTAPAVGGPLFTEAHAAREPLAPPLPGENPLNAPRVSDTHAPRRGGSLASRLVRTLLVLVILGGIGYAVYESRIRRIPPVLHDPAPTRDGKDTRGTPEAARATPTPSPTPSTSAQTAEEEPADPPSTPDPDPRPKPDTGARVETEPRTDAETETALPTDTEAPPETTAEADPSTPPPAPDPERDPEYTRLMELAQAAMRKQDFDAAMNHAAEALQHELTSEATTLLDAARMRRHFQQTRNQALERARSLLEQEKWSEADEAVQRVLVIEIYMQDEEALAIQQAARKGQYDGIIARADELLEAGDFDAAEMAYMQAMMIEGYATDTRAVEGQRTAFQAKMDATESARAEDRRRRELEMKYTLSMEEAQRLMEERKWMQAVQVLDTVLRLEGYAQDPAASEARMKAVRMTEDDPTHLQDQFEQFMIRGQAFLDAGETEEAVAAFQRALLIDGFQDNAEALAKIREAQTAPPPEQAPNGGTGTPPDPTPAPPADPAFLQMYAAAARLAGEGKLTEAGTVLGQIRAMPGYADHPQVLEAIRRIDAAQEERDLRPAPTPRRDLQAELHAAGGDPLKTIQVYDQALRDRPGDRALQIRRLYALIDAGRFEDARTEAEALGREHANDAWMQVTLGTIHRQDGMYRSAAEAFERAVQVGSPAEAVAAARFGLGELHFSSGRAGDFRTGITQDNEKAVAYLQEAAEAGNPTAMNNLGVAYAIGRGTRRDREEAASWFSRAAEAGDPAGQFNYALILEQGSGVNRDFEAAASWYEKAVDQGVPRAAARLAEMVRRGRGTERDDERARSLQTRAGEESARDSSPLLAVQSRALPALPVIQAAPPPRAPRLVRLPEMPGVAMPEEDRSPMQDIRPGAEAAMRFQSIMEEGQRLLMAGEAEQARQVFALALRVPGYENNMMALTNVQAAEQILAAQRRSAPPPDPQAPPAGRETTPSTLSAEEAQYKSMMEEGRRLIIEQDWEAAIDVYIQILRIPGYTLDADAQNALRMAREARDVEEAARRPGYTLTPEERTTREYLAFMRKGHEQLAQKQWIVAKTIFGYALELPGYEADPNALAGQRAAEEGLRGEVVAREAPLLLDVDMRDTATYTAIMQEAVRQYQQGRYEGAEQLFQMVLELEGFEADGAATRGLLMAQQLKGSGMQPDPSVTLESLQSDAASQPPRAPQEPRPQEPPTPTGGIVIPPVEAPPPAEPTGQPPAPPAPPQPPQPVTPPTPTPAPPTPSPSIPEGDLDALVPPVPLPPTPEGSGLPVPAPVSPSDIVIPDPPRPVVDVPLPPTPVTPSSSPVPPAPVPSAPGTESASPSPVPPPVPSPQERARAEYQALMVEASRLLSRGAYAEAEAAYRGALTQPGYEEDPMARIGVETAIREQKRVAGAHAPQPEEVPIDIPVPPMPADTPEGAGSVRFRLEDSGSLLDGVPGRETAPAPEGVRDALDDLFADDDPTSDVRPKPDTFPTPDWDVPERIGQETLTAEREANPYTLPAEITSDDFARPRDADTVPRAWDDTPPAPERPESASRPLPDASTYREGIVPPIPGTDIEPVSIPPVPVPAPVPAPPRPEDIVPPLPAAFPVPEMPHTQPGTTPPAADARPPFPAEDGTPEAGLDAILREDPFHDLFAAADPVAQHGQEGGVDARPPTRIHGTGETPDMPGGDPVMPPAPITVPDVPPIPDAFPGLPDRAPRTPDPSTAYAQRMREAQRHMDSEEWGKAQEAFEQALSLPGYDRDAAARAGVDQARSRARLAAQRPSARQLVEEGNRLENSGQFEEAIVAYSSAIDLEPANPILWLSRADARVRIDQYRSAIADYERVLELSTDSATRVYTYNHLANAYYFSETDFERAVAYYRKAAEAGDAAAMNSLGVCYGFGRGVERNPRTSLDWYRRAAERGYGLSMVNLGLAYQLGRDVETDYGRARIWYERAAEAGVPRAYVRLAILYEQGLGVEVDGQRAAEYRRRARALGYEADG